MCKCCCIIIGVHVCMYSVHKIVNIGVHMIYMTVHIFAGSVHVVVYILYTW